MLKNSSINAITMVRNQISKMPNQQKTCCTYQLFFVHLNIFQKDQLY